MRDVYEIVLCREGHPVPLFVSICTMQVHCRKTGQMEWKDNGKLALASLWRGTRCSPELCSDRAGTSITRKCVQSGIIAPKTHSVQICKNELIDLNSKGYIFRTCLKMCKCYVYLLY